MAEGDSRRHDHGRDAAGDEAATAERSFRSVSAGGSGAHHRADVRGIACAILTVSDSRSPETDTSGREIRTKLEQAGHRVDDYRIVQDDPELVRSILDEYEKAGRIDVVLLSGGTGIAVRDTTYEAVSSLLTKRIDGFGELFRALSMEEIGAAAMLSRAVAGLVGTMAVFSMPGSTAACRLAMEKLIVPQLAHLVGLSRPRP